MIAELEGKEWVGNKDECALTGQRDRMSPDELRTLWGEGAQSLRDFAVGRWKRRRRGWAVRDSMGVLL